MFLIIKGSLADAIEAALSRGIAFVGSAEPVSGSVYCNCDESHESTVRNWFNEPGKAPFAAGSLLFFNESKGI